MLRDRKLRFAILLAAAVFIAFFAWRSGERSKHPCTPGRIEEKDASGKVVKITRTECAG